MRAAAGAAAAALAAALGLGAAGCGDNGPSRAGWARQATEVCERQHIVIDPIAARRRALLAAPDQRGYFALAQAVEDDDARATRQLADALELLDRPGDDDAIPAWTQAVRARAQATDALAVAYSQAALTQDESTIGPRAEAVDRLDQAADRKAVGLGVPACAPVS